MSRDCVQLFCDCEYYTGKEEQVDTKVYLAVGFMLVVVTAAVRIGQQWFIFKDYYLMKERSPLLCILMITFFAIQLMLYPLVYTYNYFTFNWGEIKYAYRTIFYALDGSLYFIYLMRGLRLVYAHEIDTSLNNTWIFKFFKNEYNLVIFILVGIAIKIIPIVCTDFDNDIFLTFIDVNFHIYGGTARISVRSLASRLFTVRVLEYHDILFVVADVDSQEVLYEERVADGAGHWFWVRPGLDRYFHISDWGVVDNSDYLRHLPGLPCAADDAGHQRAGAVRDQLRLPVVQEADLPHAAADGAAPRHREDHAGLPDGDGVH